MPKPFPTESLENRDKVKAHLKEIYDAYRTASMNCTYYERRLRTTQGKARSLNIFLAVLNSSAVASWIIWKATIGSLLWKILSGGACIIAVINPVLNLSGEIERLTKQRTGYNDLFFDLRFIVRDIQANHCLSEQDWSAFRSIDERFKELAQTDDPAPSKKKLMRIMQEVMTEIPVDSLWYPKKSTT